MLRSVTLLVGVLLAAAAFVGFLMLGGMMAPEPYSVIIAVRDIPAYTTLEADALGMDAQRINVSVARTLIRREEINAYLGGFVVEPIYAGEPLRKGAVVSPKNPQAVKRLALIMTDPDRVAVVIPVDAKTAPQQLESGDWVDIVISLAPGNINASRESTFASLLSTPTPPAFGSAYAAPTVAFGPTRVPTLVPTPTPAANVAAFGVDPASMNLPANKVVIQNVPVLIAKFQQIPNTSFAGSGFTASGQQASAAPRPAYIKGDIQAVTALVPRSSVELLTFGIDNGRVRLALLPAQTGQEGEQSGVQPSTFGVTFNDWVQWMMRERGAATGTHPLPANSTVPNVPRPQPPAPAQPTPAAIPAPAQPPAVDAPTAAAPRATAPARAQQNEIPTGTNVMALLIPLLCGGVLLILFVVAVRFIRKKRKADALI